VVLLVRTISGFSVRDLDAANLSPSICKHHLIKVAVYCYLLSTS